MKTKKKKTKLELYYHESQKNGKYIKGADLEKHLIETGLIDQCLSFEDEVVKGWIDKPETYPEEYKKVYPHLWKSTKTSGGYRLVAYLDWFGSRVFVNWSWLENDWRGLDPALLASSSDLGNLEKSLDPLSLDLRIKTLESQVEKIISWANKMALPEL